MKSKLTDKDRLSHILDAIKSIEEFTTGITYRDYNEDFKLRLALVKLIEIIGEASNGITLETQEKFSEIEWVVLRGIRNTLVHEYFGIDYDIVWESIKQNIPILKSKIEKILEEFEKDILKIEGDKRSEQPESADQNQKKVEDEIKPNSETCLVL